MKITINRDELDIAVELYMKIIHGIKIKGKINVLAQIEQKPSGGSYITSIKDDSITVEVEKE